MLKKRLQNEPQISLQKGEILLFSESNQISVISVSSIWQTELGQIYCFSVAAQHQKDTKAC